MLSHLPQRQALNDLCDERVKGRLNPFASSRATPKRLTSMGCDSSDILICQLPLLAEIAFIQQRDKGKLAERVFDLGDEFEAPLQRLDTGSVNDQHITGCTPNVRRWHREMILGARNIPKQQGHLLVPDRHLFFSKSR